ncbi:diguanylate phosphodiesterase [Salmonella enterica subsp. enterica]|nr:diguanylate phosphodiesterase [Salmonella enterica subsp. enterica]EDQ9876436.1 diguanylate phosphodiesterase [Salmonella enterica subsp. enterica]
MKMGEHMESIVELVNDLTDGDAEKAIKVLSLVVLEYMLSVDCTEFEVSAGTLNINVSVEES